MKTSTGSDSTDNSVRRPSSNWWTGQMDLMAEFDLELVPDYIARHDRAEADTRAGRTPEPQPPRRVKAQYV